MLIHLFALKNYIELQKLMTQYSQSGCDHKEMMREQRSKCWGLQFFVYHNNDFEVIKRLGVFWYCDLITALADLSDHVITLHLAFLSQSAKTALLSSEFPGLVG